MAIEKGLYCRVKPAANALNRAPAVTGQLAARYQPMPKRSGKYTAMPTTIVPKMPLRQ